MDKSDLRSDEHEFKFKGTAGTVIAVSPLKGDKYLIISTLEETIEVPIDKINDAIDDVEAWERAACYAARQKANGA